MPCDSTDPCSASQQPMEGLSINILPSSVYSKIPSPKPLNPAMVQTLPEAFHQIAPKRHVSSANHSTKENSRPRLRQESVQGATAQHGWVQIAMPRWTWSVTAMQHGEACAAVRPVPWWSGAWPMVAYEGGEESVRNGGSAESCFRSSSCASQLDLVRCLMLGEAEGPKGTTPARWLDRLSGA